VLVLSIFFLVFVIAMMCDQYEAIMGGNSIDRLKGIAKKVRTPTPRLCASERMYMRSPFQPFTSLLLLLPPLPLPQQTCSEGFGRVFGEVPSWTWFLPIARGSIVARKLRTKINKKE